jgi:tetratricopeptide (TPR) repeat protein
MPNPVPDFRSGRGAAAPRRARSVLAGVALALALASSPPTAAETKPDALKLYLDGKYDEARRICLAELAADPGNLESYVVISWCLLALERYADAENYALKGYAIQREARLTEALGEAAYFLGRNDAALRNFQNYVSAVPEGGRVGVAYYYTGEVYLRLGRYAHADIALSTALQYSPGNARWWTRLGWAREKSGDAVHSLEAYEKALSLDPRLQDALNGKVRVASRIR